jgi:hypothetical protein
MSFVFSIFSRNHTEGTKYEVLLFLYIDCHHIKVRRELRQSSIWETVRASSIVVLRQVLLYKQETSSKLSSNFSKPPTTFNQ